MAKSGDYGAKPLCSYCTEGFILFPSGSEMVCPSCGGSGNAAGPGPLGDKSGDVCWVKGDDCIYGYSCERYGYEFVPLQGTPVKPRNITFGDAGYERVSLPFVSKLDTLICACGVRFYTYLELDYRCKKCRAETDQRKD